MNIAILGLPGSGKTFFAEQLALIIDGTHVSSDALRKNLSQQGKYNDQSKTIVYQQMLDLMEDSIKNQKSVVLDATFCREDIRNLFIKKAALLNSPLYWIEIKAADFVIKYRISKKREDSEADFGLYLKMKSEFEHLTEEHLILYSDLEELESMLDKALNYIHYQDETAAG